jgi:serine/threonine-protein kinase
MNKIVKILMSVVAAIIAFIIIFAIGRAVGIFKVGPGTNVTETAGKVKVPDVVGKTEKEAKEILKKKGLGIKVVSREESATYDEGIVASQKQVAGTKVNKNTTVEVVVSSGKTSETVAVPDVTGVDEESASATLRSAGFKVDTEYVFNDAESGQVVATNPPAGEQVAKGSTVILSVSKGQDSKSVPNVVGKTEDEARAIIEGAGLKVDETVTYDFNDSYEQGHVFAQNPSNGKVPAGTAIKLSVSNGKKPPEDKAVPPSIVGKTEDKARALLEGAGFVVNVVYAESEDDDTGIVVLCEPASGQKLPPGSTVTITVGTGGKTGQ